MAQVYTCAEMPSPTLITGTVAQLEDALADAIVSSRAGDPLLHTHVVTANMTCTEAGAWRAIDGVGLYEHAKSVSNFPDAAYLADDLVHQVRLKQLIDRASQAIALRRAAR